MQYSADRLRDRSGEPSLEEMTEFAVKLLSKNDKGFFLLVEGEFWSFINQKININLSNGISK